MRMLKPTQTRQPAGPAAIDWGNPITKGLAYARAGADLDTSVRVGTRRLPHPAGMVDGIGSTFGSGTTDSIELPFGKNAIQRTYLVLCDIRGAGGGANGRLFDKRTTTPQNELMFTNGSQMRYGRSFTTGTGEWFCTAPTNRLFAYALTYDSSSVSNVPKMYVDGVSQSVSTFATPTTGPALVTTEPYVLGNIKTVNSRNWDGLIGEFIVWDRILSDDEIAQVSRNPWQVFRSPSRLGWVFEAGAGGGTQTLTATRFDNTNTFYAATLSPGAVTLTPSLVTNDNTFYAATVTAGAVTLTAPQIASTNAFFSASVGVGAVTLSPTLVVSSNAFYSHSLSQSNGLQTLSPPLVASTPFSTRPALLLHMDGTNGSTVIVDDSSYSASFTNIGSATLTTSDKVFGSASLSMTRGFTINGDIDRFKFSGDYTIDMWIKVSSWTNDALFTMTDSPGFLKYLWNLNAQGGLELTSIGASSTSSKTADAIVPLNTWTHVQIARSGTTTRIWLDGTVRSTFTDSANYAAGVHGVARVQIGEYVGNEQFNGLMDEVRVLSGEAANTGNFTPPSAAYSYSSTGFFDHSVTVGVVSLSAARFDNANTFYNHTLTAAAPSQSLTASLFTNNNAFYTHVVTTTITLTPSLYSNDNEFYSHQIMTSAALLTVPLYVNDNLFFSGALFRAGLADEFSRERVVYVPADNTIIGAVQNVNRTVYVTATNTATV